MTRSWAEFLGDAEAGGPEPEERGRGWFRRLRDSLSASRQALTSELATAVFDPGDDEAWERIEEALLQADVGVPATVEIVGRLEERRPATQHELVAELEVVIADLVSPVGEARLALDGRPTVVLVVGVNGTGKTTTIGKLASRLRESGRSVILAAADTFRAAAEEQLEIWARRAQADFVGSERGADPAAVAYDAIDAAVARGRDVVIVDTAGRLHTQTNLMDELAKVRRVVAQRLDGAPHETLLVVDATTGQNGLQQARLFGSAVDVTGVALTKLDGTAKGGIAVAIAHELGLPVKLVGVGESLDDLQPFDPRDFARALVSGEP
ncbi:MAG: signal recognition particle-docking protein FtsY [Thermoleophilia bacterium]|nr:signal recognition particle-docking protein FtsY [Thermoleophilia bacterium]